MVLAMEAREGPIIHLSSVFMTNGRADTPSHSVLESCRFRVPAFDQRQHDLCGYCHLYMINMTWISNLEVISNGGVGAWRMPFATSVDWYSSLEGDPCHKRSPWTSFAAVFRQRHTPA